MNIEQNQVAELMRKMGQATPDSPQMTANETRELRIKLIAEELCELSRALRVDLGICDAGIDANAYAGGADLVESYDAIVDLLVVVIGTAVAMGITIQPGWDEVQRSNMTKIGGGLDANGKFRKGPDYSPPNLQRIIQQQLEK